MSPAGPQPDWLTCEEALAAILDRCEPLAIEPVSIADGIEDALGRALAEDVVSRVAHPPWDNSAMDGFAVRARDVEGAGPDHPVRLPLSGDVPAGSFPEGPLEPGTAVKVMTGAPVPEGATGVIRAEHTDGGDGEAVTFLESSDASRNIRRAGEDLRRGERVLRAGDELTPAAVGLLAMTARSEVRVHRRPRVALLSTGDELADWDEVEEALEGRKIMNSNSYALAAQLRTAGALPVLLGIARDEPAAVREKLERAAGCDGVVSSAGVSVGEHDVVKAALESLGMRRVFWRARIRPGSPLTFGTLAGVPFWGLPGNPVSSMVTFEVFLRPALRKLAGHRRLHRRRLAAVAAQEIESRPELTHFFRVRLEERPGERPLARLTGPQGSGILTSMAAADGLLVVPEGTERIVAGSRVEVIPLRETAAEPGREEDPGAGREGRGGGRERA